MAETEYQHVPRTESEMLKLLNDLTTPLEGNIHRDIVGSLFELILRSMVDAGYTDVQVEMAKGRFKDLASRLDAGEAVALNALNEANRKINNASGAVTMDNLSQAVKTAMTGGSVAVVGEGAVGVINLNAELSTLISDWQAVLTTDNESWEVV